MTNDPPASTTVSNGDLKEAASLFDNLISLDKTIEEICSADVLCRIRHLVERQKEALKQSRTACLRLQYMDIMDILRIFIKAERTGNWDLHLHTVCEMLPYSLAAGHTYGKSAYVHLNNMLELESQHPDVHTSFTLGKHVIRRSDRYWAGLSSDLVIGQVLMRSVKTTGGLTRGRGLTETHKLVWLLSMPACAEVNCALQDLTAVNYNTSDQNKEATRARQERDSKDTEELLKCLTIGVSVAF